MTATQSSVEPGVLINVKCLEDQAKSWLMNLKVLLELKLNRIDNCMLCSYNSDKHKSLA